MFDELRDKIISIFTSRLTVLTIVFFVLGGILTYRCFDLQIVHGEEYLEDFVLQTEKTRDITSTRGRIFDKNGNLLAYKNKNLNDTILQLIRMIEKNGDNVITDFRIYVDEDGEFAYSVEGTTLLRFLADVYGYTTVDKLKDDERTATAQEVKIRRIPKRILLPEKGTATRTG